jgi:hypothetical protein
MIVAEPVHPVLIGNKSYAFYGSLDFKTFYRNYSALDELSITADFTRVSLGTWVW